VELSQSTLIQAQLVSSYQSDYYCLTLWRHFSAFHLTPLILVLFSQTEYTPFCATHFNQAYPMYYQLHVI
jgi:hypothetical protein